MGGGGTRHTSLDISGGQRGEMDRLRGIYRSTGKSSRELLPDSLWFLRSERVITFGVCHVCRARAYVHMWALRTEEARREGLKNQHTAGKQTNQRTKDLGKAD